MTANATVWNALIAELQDWMVTTGYGDSVYMTERPNEETISQYAIQIIPGGDTDRKSTRLNSSHT